MSRAAVICEFNPFHNGHKFLLEKIKKEYADEIVCIMSGNFVQRGDIAITDKYSRAKAALQNGAAMVAELPTVYAMSNARVFAQNGVRMAKSLGCSLLCFGAEDDLQTLTQLADRLENDTVNARIQACMQDGMYYPKALSTAVGEDFEAIIRRPNNILALEYIRACRQYDITPIAIKRKGTVHDDDTIHGDIASASKIRSLVLDDRSYAPYTPMMITQPCSIRSLESAILYRLKTISTEKLASIADVSEGLENRIICTAKANNSTKEILNAIKTKRYTMARLRRIALCALLDITQEMQNRPVPYARVLGMKAGSEALLKNCTLPLIVKTRSDYEKLDDTAKEIFQVDLRAAEAMNISMKNRIINEFSQELIKQYI